ncbi:MAG: hypothetical protein FWF88_13725 [Peptococcaceae bacterium]|nr:hypothetical protein [Peptococcaceae bacterium]
MSVPSGSMIDFVRVVLIMTLSGSALITILLAVKPLLRNRLHQTVQYGLWLVALAALLIPVPQILVPPMQETSPLMAPLHAVIDHNIISPAAEGSRSLLNQSFSSLDGDPGSGSGLDPNPNSGAPKSLFAAICTGLMVAYPWVVALILLYHIISFAYFLGKLRYRKIPPTLAIATMRNLRTGKRIPRLCLSPMAGTPMLVGFFRPMIVLPDKDYTDIQLKNVLLHELTHLRRFDVVIKCLSVFACALHWFNPLVWLARREIDRTCELSCDAAVIRTMNAEDKKNYGHTLIALASHAKVSRAVLSVTLYEKKNSIKERLTLIKRFSPDKPVNLLVSAFFLVAAIVAACLLGTSTGFVAGSVTASPLGNASNEAAQGNPIPTNDIGTLLPSSLHNGSSQGINVFTLETDSGFLNVPGGVNNGSNALRVEQKNRNAFAGYLVSLKRDTVYEFKFDVMILYDSTGNTDINLDVCAVIGFKDPDITTRNHWPGTLPKVESGVWKTVKGTYDTTYPNGGNKPPLHADATPEDAYFAFFVAANGDNPITYLVDNVELKERGTTENLIPNGNFETPIPIGYLD